MSDYGKHWRIYGTGASRDDGLVKVLRDHGKHTQRGLPYVVEHASGQMLMRRGNASGPRYFGSIKTAIKAADRAFPMIGE